MFEHYRDGPYWEFIDCNIQLQFSKIDKSIFSAYRVIVFGNSSSNISHINNAKLRLYIERWIITIKNPFVIDLKREIDRLRVADVEFVDNQTNNSILLYSIS